MNDNTKMSLIEAIQHCDTVAAECDLYEVEIENACGDVHRQIARYLRELKDARATLNDCDIEMTMLIDELSKAKKYLRLAMNDFELLNRENARFKNCMIPEIDCADCPLNNEKDEPCRTWRYSNEVKKLLDGGYYQ